MAADRAIRRPPARSPRQERDSQRAPNPRGRDASTAQATPRVPQGRLRVRFRARRANQPHRFPPACPAPRGGRQDAIPNPPAHASPCLWVQAGQRWSRHEGATALSRAALRFGHGEPRKLNMASPGTGTGAHIAGELFKMMAGVDMVHVPYRGAGPAITDLLGGQVQVYFVTTGASIEYIRADRLRALAVTTATRSDALPEIPTVGE